MQELEAKFLAGNGKAPEKVLRRLQETLAWAGFRIQPEGRRASTDVYYDSADHQLRAAGWSYRQRDDAGVHKIALKEVTRARAAVFDRMEVEQIVDGDAEDMTRPPSGPVQARLSNLLHPDARVAPLFTVHKRRAAYHLSHPDHPRGLVEMALDRTRIGRNAPPDSDDPGAALSRAAGPQRVGAHRARAGSIEFTELELELKEGPHELLASILAAVELEPSLLAARLSKYERGLIATGYRLERRTPGRPQVDRQSRWLDIAVAHLHAQLHQLRLYEPYAWEGIHAEGVHQMRVATRRAHAALRAFAQVLPAEEAQRLVPRLRWLAGALGAVRDLDVHLDRMRRYRRRTGAGGQAVLDRYEGHLLALRDTAHRDLTDALDSDAYAALLADYRALLDAAVRPVAAESGSHRIAAESGSHRIAAESRSHTVAAESRSHTVAAEGRSHTVAAESRSHRIAAEGRSHTVAAEGRAHSSLKVEDVARSTVAPLLERVYRKGRRIDGDASGRRMHRLRIVVKRLRYKLEFLQPAYPGMLDEAVAALQTLQQHLGVHQDARVARRHLADYVEAHGSGRRARRVFERLIAREKRRRRRQRELFADDWQRLEAATAGLTARL